MSDRFKTRDAYASKKRLLERLLPPEILRVTKKLAMVMNLSQDYFDLGDYAHILPTGLIALI